MINADDLVFSTEPISGCDQCAIWRAIEIDPDIDETAWYCELVSDNTRQFIPTAQLMPVSQAILLYKRFSPQFDERDKGDPDLLICRASDELLSVMQKHNLTPLEWVKAYTRIQSWVVDHGIDLERASD